MRIALSTLVIIILSAAALVMMLAITSIFSTTATDNVNTCAANVAVRASIVATNTPTDTPLHGCTSEKKTLSGDEQQIRSGLVAAYTRCKAMFGPAQNQRLTRDSAVFCHVCGIYDVKDHDEIAGISDEIRTQQGDPGLLEALFTQSESDAQFRLDTSGYVGVLFVQDNTVDHTFFSRIMHSVTSRLSAIGALISNPDSETDSAIVIRPYTQEYITQIGCTTVDASQS